MKPSFLINFYCPVLKREMHDAVVLVPCSDRISQEAAIVLEQKPPKICPLCKERFSMFVPDIDFRIELAAKKAKSEAELRLASTKEVKLVSPWGPVSEGGSTKSFADIQREQLPKAKTLLEVSKPKRSPDKAPEVSLRTVRASVDVAAIEMRLNFAFKNISYLEEAFTHKSYVNEHPGKRQHNQRLEYLGDSILGGLIAEYLYNKFPTQEEGELTNWKAALVDKSACAKYAKKLQVYPFMLIGKGEKETSDPSGRPSTLADLFEAIIGAIFLDAGWNAVRNFLFEHFSEEFDALLEAPIKNWKGLLQEAYQEIRLPPPTYFLLSETGPDHRKCFEVIVKASDQIIGGGTGMSKKEAEQAAAQDAFKHHLI